MYGLPSWLFPQAAQAGGPIMPPQGFMGAPPPFGPGGVPMPPALTARAHAAAAQGGPDRTATARYGQTPTNPQGEWGSLARMLGLTPQTPPPVGGAPPPVGMPGMMPPHPGQQPYDPTLAAGMAAGAMGGPPPTGPGDVPMPPQGQPPGPPPMPGLISPAEAATPPGGGLEELQAPEMPPLSPGDVGPRAMAPGVVPMPRPPFQGQPPVPKPQPSDRPAQDSRALVAASSPPDMPMGGYTPPAPPGWGPAGPDAHGGGTGLPPGVPLPPMSGGTGGPGDEWTSTMAPGLPPPPDGGRPAPAPDAGSGSGAAQPSGWDKFKHFWTDPMGGDPTGGALAAMGLAPQAPNRLQGLASALMGFGGNMLAANMSGNPAARRNALGYGLLGAGQGWAAPAQQYQQAMPRAIQGYASLAAEMRKASAPVTVGNNLVDPHTGKVVYQGPQLEKLGPGEVALDLAHPGAPALTNPNPNPAMMGEAGKLAMDMGLQPGTPEHNAFVQKFGDAQIHDMLLGHGTNVRVTPQIITNPENRASQLTYDMTKDQLKDLGAGWAKAQGMQGDANTLVSLAIHGQQEGGPLADFKQQMVNMGQSLGIQFDPKTIASANDNAIFGQLVNHLAPAMRVAGSGSNSDKDINIFMSTLPGVKDTREQQIMKSLAFKQMTDYTANQGHAVNAAIEHLGASGKLPTMSEAGQMATKAIGDSWLPRVSAKKVDAGGVFQGPTLYLDTDSGRIGYYMPGGG